MAATSTAPKVKTIGFRKHLTDCPAVQRTKAEQLRDDAIADGARLITIRPATWIGPGCHAERGALVLEVHGGERRHQLLSVFSDGSAF